MSARGLYRLATLLLLVFFASAAAAWPALPDRIPTHFGPGGAPDRWKDTTLLAWFGLPLAAAAMTLFLRFIGRLGARHPGVWSIPDKDRFLRLTDAQRAPIIERLETFIGVLAIAMILFFAVIQADIYASALGAPGLSAWFWAGFGGIMGLSVGGGIWLYARIGGWITEAQRGTPR